MQCALEAQVRLQAHFPVLRVGYARGQGEQRGAVFLPVQSLPCSRLWGSQFHSWIVWVAQEEAQEGTC
jgi:hypothetical protein